MTIELRLRNTLKEEHFIWRLESTDLVELLGTTRGPPVEEHCSTGCIPNNTQILDASGWFVCWAFLFTKVRKVNLVGDRLCTSTTLFNPRNYSTEVDKIWYELSTKVVYFWDVLVQCWPCFKHIFTEIHRFAGGATTSCCASLATPHKELADYFTRGVIPFVWCSPPASLFRLLLFVCFVAF